MPYDTSTESLRRLVTRILQENEFAKLAEDAGVSQEQLVTLLSRSPEIWSAGGAERVEFDRLEAEYNARLDKEVETRRERQRHQIELMRIVPLGIIVFLLMMYFIIRYSPSPPEELTGLSQWLVPLVAVISSGAVSIYHRYRKNRFNKSAYSARWDLEEGTPFPALAKQLLTARGKVDEAIISQGVKTKTREILDTLLAVPFSTHLPRLDYSGLSDVFNSANEIATDAKKELEFMLETMPGGSIGIAGPRGSGKSTLLKSACADRAGNLEKRKVIPLFTTSPVEYEGRDFILHLFSAICNKMLQITTYHTARLGAFDEIARAQAVRRHVKLSRLAPIALLVGIALLLISLMGAAVNMTAKVGDATQNPNSQTQAAATPTPQSTAPPQPSPTPRSKFTRFIQALDFKPGLFFTSGLLLMLGYFVVFLLSRYWRLPDAPPEGSRIRGLDLDFKVKANLEKIRDDAKFWLEDIKFQQSFTSGWSGAVKLPVGLEGGVNTAVSLAQKQLSLPDITRGFSDFLSSISSEFKIIIGIDELDKLESDDAAQRFLNEIKAVFGLPNVFYLISVSENAMSNFERRGLPFRDVFDSSFDNIVYVEYLQLKHAKRLIARRVVAMPPPFVHLCYCISGGLARDLVRTCRNLMRHAHAVYELDQEGAGSNLKDLSAALIASDLRLKLHALVVAAKRLTPDTSVSAFLAKLYSLENELHSVPSLLRAYEDLMKQADPALSGVPPTNGATGLVEVYDKLKERLSGVIPDVANVKAVSGLYEELASYLYYCVTLLEFFSETINPTVFAKAEDKVFDTLARARQYLGINPAVTRMILDDFRKSYEMTMPNTGPPATIVV